MQSCDLAEEDGTGGILKRLDPSSDRDLRSVSLHVQTESTW